MRFRPEQHLSRQSDIRTTREQGRRIEGRAFTVWWKSRAPARAPDHLVAPVPPPASTPAHHRPRVCVIASTAAVGHAVLRNTAKRRLREIFRRHQQLLPADTDLLLIARSGAVSWPMPELEKKFAEACRLIAPSGFVTGEK
jgi:ribonuclease P protein component